MTRLLLCGLLVASEADGKSAFEAAAVNEKDPEHAKTLRAAASTLSTKGACP